MANLKALLLQIADCKKCGLKCKNKVIWAGQTNPDLILVGEAPGEEEDATGKPFMGKAGQELNGKLEGFRAIKLNCLKCRPTDAQGKNRPPQAQELANCLPFLFEQMEYLKEKYPKALVITLGTVATASLFGKEMPRDALFSHSHWGDCWAMLHPAAMLHNPGKRKDWDNGWEALKAALKNRGIAREGMVQLHCHSEFSYLDSCNRVDKLAKFAASKGFGAISCTDHYNCHGLINFYDEAKKNGLNPILGLEAAFSQELDEPSGHLLIIAKNQAGYQTILRLIYESEIEAKKWRDAGKKQESKRVPILFRHLAKWHDGIAIGTACIGGFITKKVLEGKTAEAQALAMKMKALLGPDFYFEVQPTKLAHESNLKLARLAKATGIGLLATNDVHYLEPTDIQLHNMIKGIAQPWNDKPGFDDATFWLKTETEMVAGLPEDQKEIIKAGIQNAKALAAACKVEIVKGANYLPQPPNRKALLERMLDLAAIRMQGKGPEYLARMRLEIERLTRLGFMDYLALIFELTEWARKQGFRIGTRGSVGGSLFAHVLGLTGLDPVAYGLIFDRFISESRIDLPDVDIDIDARFRGQAIQHLREVYGADKVAHILVPQRAKGKMALQDICRAAKIPIPITRRLTELVATRTNEINKDGATVAEIFEKFEYAKQFGATHPGLVDYAKKYENLVRQATTHAAGVLVSSVPLYQLVPLEYRTIKTGEVLHSGYDHRQAEALGLVKIDVLGVAGYAIVATAEHEIKKEKSDFSIDKIPLDDKKTFELFSQGKTVGIFQMESRGMQALCKQIRPCRLETIIDIVSLYRPGPLGSGMMKTYCQRSQENWKPETEEDKAFLKWTGESLGCCIYQEQVMIILNKMGNLSMERADAVRKIIGKKSGQAAIDRHRADFVEGAKANGFSEKVANGVFNKILEFASYAFNKAHGAAYALIAYQMQYLKAHFPSAFFLGLLRETHKKINRFVLDARQMGIKVEFPDINHSAGAFSLDDGRIFAGLDDVLGVGPEAARLIVAERWNNGPFKSIPDLIQRVGKKGANARVIKGLAKADGFRSIGLDHAAAVVEAENLTRKAKEKLPPPKRPFTEVEAYEIRAKVINLPPEKHPCCLYPDVLELIPRPLTKLDEIEQGSPQFANIVALLVELKVKHEAKWSKDGGKVCIADIEDETGANQIVFSPDQYEAFKEELKQGKGQVYIFTGIAGRFSRIEGLAVAHIKNIGPGHPLRQQPRDFQGMRLKNEGAISLEEMEIGPPEGRVLAEIVSSRTWISKKGNLTASLGLVDDTGFNEMLVWKDNWERYCEKLTVGKVMLLDVQRLGEGKLAFLP